MMLPQNVVYFKEEILDNVIEVPCCKPNVDKVVDAKVEATVLHSELIKTDIGISNEGQNLSGYKLIVQMKFHEKITYRSGFCENRLYDLGYETTRTSFVIVPHEVNGKQIEKLFQEGKISVRVYIEDISISEFKRWQIHNCIVFFVNVDIKA